MFADVDADIYVLVDGDSTYEAEAAPRMIDVLVTEGLDMVTGCRVTDVREAYRPGHKFGNWMLTSLVTSIFGRRTKDMLSGYRVFPRRFVKGFPALSRGFGIETELTVHALELRMPIADVDTVYVDRLPGSESKLRTFEDGFRILLLIALFLGCPILAEFLETGLVPRFPTASLAASIVVIAVLSLVAGIILDKVALGRREMKRL